MKEFIKYFIVWVAENLSIPFWMVGHVHLTINVYNDVHEVLSSLGMNIIVAIGFWIKWKEHARKKRKMHSNR